MVVSTADSSDFKFLKLEHLFVVLKGICQPSGCLSRRTFWWASIWYVPFIVIVFLTLYFLTPLTMEQTTLPLEIAAICIWLPASVRRVRDCGRWTGWAYIYTVMTAIGYEDVAASIKPLYALFYLAVALHMLILCCLPSRNSRNSRNSQSTISSEPA